MKINSNYILLFILLLVTSCDECDPEAVKLVDITGSWKFSSPSYSGEISIVKSLNGKFAVEPGANFLIDNKAYKSTSAQDLIILSGLEIEVIPLNADNGRLNLDEVIYNGDFTKMTSSFQFKVTCASCTEIQTFEDVVFTRK